MHSGVQDLSVDDNLTWAVPASNDHPTFIDEGEAMEASEKNEESDESEEVMHMKPQRVDLNPTLPQKMTWWIV